MRALPALIPMRCPAYSNRSLEADRAAKLSGAGLSSATRHGLLAAVRTLSGCREWVLGEVETVAHPVGLAVAVGKRLEPEGVFAEFEDADVEFSWEHIWRGLAYGLRTRHGTREPNGMAGRRIPDVRPRGAAHACDATVL